LESAERNDMEEDRVFPIEQKSRRRPGTTSVHIGRVLLVLQGLWIYGHLGPGPKPLLADPRASVGIQAIQALCFLGLASGFALGALLLGLICWLQHKHPGGKPNVILAGILIIAQVLVLL